MPFHDSSNNAGAKVINYYIKKISTIYDTSVLLTCDYSSEIEIMKSECFNVIFIYKSDQKLFFQKVYDYILFKFYYRLYSFFSPNLYRTNGYVKNRLKLLFKSISNPNSFDFIIAEFPPIILQPDIIREFFKTSKIIASIHDVSFQSLERSIDNKFVCISKQNYIRLFKHYEINKLKKYNLIVTLNDKDTNLLVENNIESDKIFNIIPYFDTFQYTPSLEDGIIFYAAMNRPENIASIKWFIDNVWAKYFRFSIIKLYIVGGGVTTDFKKYCSQFMNIVITGFIADPTPYFNKSYGMIVPLQYGAGIKIKSLEALASGIPLLANKIGIEGISVKSDIEYLHCELPEEWKNNIENLLNDKILRKNLNQQSKKYMIDNFNREQSLKEYVSKLEIL